MKYIDFLVKKVLSESLTEKADELTNKIQEKISGEMGESECMEGDCGEMEEGKFKEGLIKAYKRKHPGKKFPASLKKKYFSDDEDDDDDETDIMSGEFDYVAEAECMEGDCGETEEGNAFTGALVKAKKEGDKTFEVGGKKFDVKETDEEMGEGNAFTGALVKAKEEGKDEFTVDGKKYNVQKESFSYSIQFGNEEVILTENELITMIEEIVLEEKKSNLKSTGRANGTVEYDRVHKKDGDINKKANEESFKKMKDYVKAGSKGSFETNPKHFPKGNGQLAKMDKKTYKASDAVDEYIDTFAYGGGMLDLDPDEIGYNEDWLEKTIEGSSMTGNSPKYANAEDTGYGKKLNKRRKEGLYNQEKRQNSYKRFKQPVDVAGENTKSGKLNKMFKNLGESQDEQKNILSEEMDKMKKMIGYNKNTQ
jgi:hypothetical protein